MAILIETSTAWGAGIVRGVGEYAQEHGPWLFFLEPRGRYEELSIPRGWEGDGIIARVTSERLSRQLVSTGKPSINVSWFEWEGAQIPRCSADEIAAGKLAADHLVDCGFAEFGYFGPIRRPGYTDQLGSSFVESLVSRGHKCSRFGLTRKPRLWHQELTELGKWLESLPKPVAVLAWNDARGRQVTEACVYAGIRVPDEVAVLGGENDWLTSQMSTPSLSTIDYAPERIGFDAAAMLDQMMRGQKLPNESVLIRPRGIITRESTDVLAIDDRVLADAIRFARDHAHQGVSVEDVVRAVPLSRRVLEQRFKRVLGRSPGQEIRRIRLEKVKHLLVETEWLLSRIADACGYDDANSLARAFRRDLGVSPSIYRRQHSDR